MTKPKPKQKQTGFPCVVQEQKNWDLILEHPAQKVKLLSGKAD